MSENRKFGWLVGGAFCLLGGWGLYTKSQFKSVFLLAGIVLIAFTIISPRRLTPVRQAWEKLGEFIGMVNTTVILIILYVFILTPISLINKLVKNDQLRLKWNKNTDTYWEKHSGGNNIKQQF